MHLREDGVDPPAQAWLRPRSTRTRRGAVRPPRSRPAGGRARCWAPAVRRRTAPSRSRCRASRRAPFRRPRPAPMRISARPAASASFRNATGRWMRADRSARASVPIQRRSMFAAVIATPRRATVGNASPNGPVDGMRPAMSASRSMTAAGEASAGVGTRRTSSSSAPRAGRRAPPLRRSPDVKREDLRCGGATADSAHHFGRALSPASGSR